MSSITLTAVQRQTLLSLQQVTELNATTQERLNTGKKVNSATDDAVAYFRSASLYSRADQFTNFKTNIDQSIQSLNSALTAASSVEGLLSQLKAVLVGAEGASSNTQRSSTQQFKDIAGQLAQLVKDSTYQGLNILTSSSAVLTTQVSDRTAATFVVSGYNLLGSGQRGIFTQSTAVFNNAGALKFSALVKDSSGTTAATSFTQLNLAASQGSTIAGTAAEAVFTNATNAIDSAITQLQGIISSLGTNVAILTARSNFSTDYANVLQSGGDKLTLADLNTEAANSQALNLRQQLGIQSLTSSATQNSSILSLLRAS